MEKTTRKTITEGLLAIFLGVFGAHYFYRGKIRWGIFRIILGWSGPVIIFLIGKIDPPSGSGRVNFALSMAFLSPLLALIFFTPVYSAIAGIIEGVYILITGNEKIKKAEADATENNNEKDNNKQIQINIKQDGSADIQDIYPQPKETRRTSVMPTSGTESSSDADEHTPQH